MTSRRRVEPACQAVRLTLDDEGRVYLVEPETEGTGGRIVFLGPIASDWRCPPGRLGEWAELASRWREEVADGRAERALRAEMLRDSLTGLPNRLAFTDFIEKAGERSERDLDHAVLVVDMLRFSRINESMGGLAGDELLITFARRLISALRAGDQLARTGGNEFGVLVSLRSSSVRQAAQTLSLGIMLVLFVPLFGIRALPAATQEALLARLMGLGMNQILAGVVGVLLLLDLGLLAAAAARFRRARLILD